MGFRRILGKGFGNGTQNQLGYIPVRYSDFIMSAWAEEQGFKGVLVAFGGCHHGVVVSFSAERPAGGIARACFWSWAWQRRR